MRSSPVEEAAALLNEKGDAARSHIEELVARANAQGDQRSLTYWREVLQQLHAIAGTRHRGP